MGREEMKCLLYEVEGAENVRDVGGYPGRDGRLLQTGRFLRGASLGGLTDAGRAALQKLGVDCVVDLRSRYEAEKIPDALGENPSIAYRHMPLLDYIQSNIVKVELSIFPSSMAEMYKGLLDNDKETFRGLFEIFAGDYETVLFHCTAGKDRTGVTAMLLMGLAGVEDEIIVEDYAYTQHLLSPPAGKLKMLPGYLFESHPDTMRAAIAHLHERYGGVEPYLDHIGVTPVQKAAVLEKLLEE